MSSTTPSCSAAGWVRDRLDLQERGRLEERVMVAGEYELLHRRNPIRARSAAFIDQNEAMALMPRLIRVMLRPLRVDDETSVEDAP